MINEEYLITQTVIRNGLEALFLTLKQYVEKKIDLERVVRVVVLLIQSGASQNNSLFERIKNRCLQQQKTDGGWIGVEDSVWSVSLLKHFSDCYPAYAHGLKWLDAQKIEGTAWGETNRDVGRIPITGVLLYLLPELSNKDSYEWLEKEWKKDFLLNPKLTYKGAFTLMALKSCNRQFVDSNLFDRTIDWLMSQQNDDYGWGPCKGHPVGSTPFCTGITLTGLLQYPEKIDRKVVAAGLNWLEKNQLADGLWPDHYIEEGSAWSFYALTHGYKFLKGNQ